MKYFILIYILLIFASADIYAQDERELSEQDSTLQDSLEQDSFEAFLAKLYDKPKSVVNQVTLETCYGLSLPSFYKTDLKGGLSKAYNTGIRYGFTRINPYLYPTDLCYYAFDYTFLENFSAHLKPRQWKLTGIITDTWRFGFGYSNGYGYKLSDETQLILYHSGNLIWSKVDAELPVPDPGDEKKLLLFDEEFRFGTSFESGIKINFFPVLYFNASYEHTLIFPAHLVWKWFGSGGIELAAQRMIDRFAYEYREQFRDNLPILNFLLKTGISYIIYEQRRGSMNFPFKSGEPMNYDTFKLGLSFVF